ncbi:prolipoprotein diacylglyceryl transferase [Agaricicola taiwanensis]|uniref:Phosphatidylglycerol--prolipoprotein diacylglyceryl transferase n=2 Tax=Agaricicola taiwanensis TaxID=591372 RepID=A0A8J2W0X1_9RHOB|nr:prolipoprotein diacylglyceryl transferase [Agaricicola taiwanensis]
MPIFAIPFPMIDPVAVSVGPLVVRWYALAYVAGLLFGWLVARWMVGRQNLWGRTPPTDAGGLDDLLVLIAFGVVLGGRIGYVFFYNAEYYAAQPLEALMVWRGGMSFHGGLLGAIAGMCWFAWRRGQSVLPIFDLIGAVAPIGIFFGRIANFVNGELWGRVSDVPWAVIFPNAGPFPRHPSQIYEAALEGLLLFMIVQVAVRLGGLRRPGLVAGIFALGYGLARIVCEFFREPDAQIGFFADVITMGMILSLPLVAGGLILITTSVKQRTA